MTTLSRILSLALLSSAALPLRAAPHAGYVYPAAGQRGTSVRLLVGGSSLGAVRDAFFTGSGATVRKIEIVPGMPNPTGPQKKWLVGQIDGGTNALPLPSEKEREDWRKCPWYDNVASLGTFEKRLVLRDLLRVRNALQTAPSIQQLAILDIDIAKGAAPGFRELRLWSHQLGISEPLKFLITEAPNALEPMYIAPARPQPPFPPQSVPVVLNGQIMPGETDTFPVRLEAGKTYRFALTGRALIPFIGDAVPGFFQPVLQLMGPAGEEVAYADDCYFNPDPVLYYKAAESGLHALNIRDNLFRGREDFVYIVAVEEKQPGPLAFREPFPGLAHFPAGGGEALAAGSPVCVTGTIASAGEEGSFLFKGKAGQKLAIETVARQIGSPLDGVLCVYSARGAKLAEAYGQPGQLFVGECAQYVDPYLAFELPADGAYRAVLADRTAKGGEDYRYWMKLGPQVPSFAVYGQHSAINVSASGWGRVKLYVDRRHGFTNDIRIASAQFRISNPVIQTNATEWFLNVQSVATNQLQTSRPQPVSFTAEPAAPGGAARRQSVVAAEQMMQAFAYDHLVPVSGFYLMHLKAPGAKAAAKKVVRKAKAGK